MHHPPPLFEMYKAVLIIEFHSVLPYVCILT